MYQIKCVHCFKSIEEKSVLFQLDEIISVLDEVDSDSVNTDNSTIIDDIESESTSKKTKISGGMGGKRRRNANSGLQKQSVSFEQTGDYLCLKPYFENGSVEVKNVLLWNVYSMEIGNKKYSGEINLKSVTRFCPFCKNRIIKDAGLCKIINIGMIGHQSAGKTVYLTIQDYVLFNSSRRQLDSIVGVPRGRLHFHGEFSHLKNGSEDEDIIHMASKRFSEQRKFPDATSSVPEPYCIRVEYRKADLPNNLTSCVICFRDILGEAFTNKEIDDAKKDLVKSYLREADAILLLTDPEAFSLNSPVDSNGDFNNKYSDMKFIISDIFSVFDGSVPKPSLCMITKEDIIAEYAANKTGKLSSIDPSSLMIAEAVSMNYQEGIDMYDKFYRLSEDTQSVMEDIVSGSWWDTMLATYFSKSVYVPISSIGRECRIFDHQYLVDSRSYPLLERKKINAQENDEEYQVTNNDTGGALDVLNPRFITLPLMYFLEKFDIIPPIYTQTSYSTIEQIIRRGVFGIGREVETIIEFDQDVYDKWVNKHSEG